MERKGGSTTVAVTAEEIRAALTKARTVSSEEEKVLRMRHGAPTDLKAPLPKASGGKAELEDELMLIELQLLRAFRARAAHAPVRAPSRNASKDKIVRALRKKR